MIRLTYFLLSTALVASSFAQQNVLGNPSFSFFKAINAGDVETFEELIVSGEVDIEDKDPFLGVSPLRLAVCQNQNQMAEALIRQGANLLDLDSFGRSVIFDAIDRNNVDLFESIISIALDLSGEFSGAFRAHLLDALCEPDVYGTTPVRYAAASNCPQIVSLLLELEHEVGLEELSFNTKDAIAGIFEYLKDPEEILRIMYNPFVKDFIRATSRPKRLSYLNILRERFSTGNPALGTVIENFQDEFAVRLSDIINFGSDKFVKKNKWMDLLLLRQEEGVDAVREAVSGKKWIGIVTYEGTRYDAILRVIEHYLRDKAGMDFAYVNFELLEEIGIDRFAGLVLPGADDNYPKGDKDGFERADLTEAQLMGVGVQYEKVLNKYYDSGIPILALCAGMQNIALNKGASLIESKEINGGKKSPTTVLKPFTLQHYMSLNLDERAEVINYCRAVDVELAPYRAHSYSIVMESFKDSGGTLAATDGAVPLAFSEGVNVIGYQFHPEARYEGFSSFGTPEDRLRQTNMVNSFFELCEGHQKWIDSGSLQGRSFAEITDERNHYFGRLLKRLEECEVRPTTLNNAYGVGFQHYPLSLDELYTEGREASFLDFINDK